MNKQSDQQADMAKIVALTRQGGRGREQAAMMLHDTFKKPLYKHFLRHYVPEPDAEELVYDTLYKFIRSEHTGVQELSPFALLWRIARNNLISWVREKRAKSRGYMGEGKFREVIITDDELLEWLEEIYGIRELSPEDLEGLIDCVQRAAVQLQSEKPRHAWILQLVTEGYSMQEIAAIQLPVEDACKPVTKRQENAAKQRVYDARRVSQPYFEHCKE